MQKTTILLALALACSCTKHDIAPTLVLFNGSVITMDGGHPHASGLRIAGDRVTDLFDGQVPPDVSGERIDLQGAVVLPGLTDAHFHLQSLGQARRELDLTATRSLKDVLAAVARAAAGTPPGAWLRGRGWDQNDWPEHAFPSARDLDQVAPNQLVWLERIDGHAVWVNSAVLQKAGITADTTNPAGGEILRDARQQPAGILIDTAIALAGKDVPEPTAAQLRTDLAQAVAACNRVGLTGVHDMGMSPEILAVLRDMERQAALKLRITAYMGAAYEMPAQKPVEQGLVRLAGIKLLADGTLGAGSAAMLAPYTDRPDSSGLLLSELQTLADTARRADAAGYQVAIHAVGDRAVRTALDALTGLPPGVERRHRIEHVQVISPDDVPRFAALGVVASIQPASATSDMPWLEARLGRVRIIGTHAWRTLMQSGAHLALGSDAPVESENPWLGIYAAVTRQDEDGKPPYGWRPQDRLKIEEALRGYTSGAAYAANQSDSGVIRPGALADLTVVDRDPLAIPVAELKSMRTLRTIVAGKEVYRATP